MAQVQFITGSYANYDNSNYTTGAIYYLYDTNNVTHIFLDGKEYTTLHQDWFTTVQWNAINSLTSGSERIASASQLGFVKIGKTITIENDGTIGVNIGSGLTADSSTGVISVDTATTSAKGIASFPAAGGLSVSNGAVSINVGDGLAIDETTHALKATYSYTLPAATTSTLGGVIVGNGISVAADGTISVNGTPAYVLYGGATTAEQKTTNISTIPLVTGKSSVVVDHIYEVGPSKFHIYTIPDVENGVVTYTVYTQYATGGSTGTERHPVRYVMNSTTGATDAGTTLITNTFDFENETSAVTAYAVDAMLWTATGGDDQTGNGIGMDYDSNDNPILQAKLGTGLDFDNSGNIALQPAASDALGGIKVGTGLSVAADGTLSATYSLPAATSSTRGGVVVPTTSGLQLGGANSDEVSIKVKSGTGLTIDGTNGLAGTIASDSALGMIKVGNGLSIANDGTLSATYSYTLPTASASTLGGVKIGNGVQMTGADSDVLGVKVKANTGLTVDSDGVAGTAATTSALGVASFPASGGLSVSSGAVSINVGDGLAIDETTHALKATYSLPAASADTRGGVKVGNGLEMGTSTNIDVMSVKVKANTGLTVDGNGVAGVAATTGALGVVQVGSNIGVSGGVISVADAASGTKGVASFPAANGFVVSSGAVSLNLGDGLEIDSQNKLKATYSYTLPAATTTTRGGVIVPASGGLTLGGTNSDELSVNVDNSTIVIDGTTNKVKVADTVMGRISTIEGKIPAAASTSNQLADKAFVNSSIATNTAYFIGTFDTIQELWAYTDDNRTNITNNDYAFVALSPTTGATEYIRYKFNDDTTTPTYHAVTAATVPTWAADTYYSYNYETDAYTLTTSQPADWSTNWKAYLTKDSTNSGGWLKEYVLNNSSFTSDQWAAINSGVTSSNYVKSVNNITPTNNNVTLTYSDVGADASGAAASAVAPINEKIPSAATSSNQLADKAWVTSQISSAALTWGTI